ncbi:MAG: response regulator [Proteobacteria bacterium]|nr:response regulator [Pseudomonadota bacterium]
MEKSDKSVLLVVDDESSVCRALSRMLKSSVDEILTAITPSEAEMVLESRKITHVICDHWFGPGLPLGLDLAAKWKEQHLSIQRAVVLTGTDVSRLESRPGVHQIMAKTVRPEELLKALGLEKQSIPIQPNTG